MWAFGGFPCGATPDLTLARQSFVLHLEDREKALGDKGYNDPSVFILPNETNAVEHKTIMARHETVNKRIRQFKVLSDRFRHKLTFHRRCFHAVVNITQLNINNGEPLFSV